MLNLEDLISNHPHMIYHITLVYGLETLCRELELDSFMEVIDKFHLTAESYSHMIEKILIHREFFEEVLPNPVCRRYTELCEKISTHKSKSKVVMDFAKTAELSQSFVDETTIDLLYDAISRVKP